MAVGVGVGVGLGVGVVVDGVIVGVVVGGVGGVRAGGGADGAINDMCFSTCHHACIELLGPCPCGHVLLGPAPVCRAPKTTPQLSRMTAGTRRSVRRDVNHIVDERQPGNL